jgi:hypothetical protein
VNSQIDSRPWMYEGKLGQLNSDRGDGVEFMDVVPLEALTAKESRFLCYRKVCGSLCVYGFATLAK